MTLTKSGLRGVFDLSEWRGGKSARREVLRSIVTRATVGGEPLEILIEELKRALGARHMNDADRNLLHVTLHDLRTIVVGWHHLLEDEQRRFLAGEGTPSTVARKIRTAQNQANGRHSP